MRATQNEHLCLKPFLGSTKFQDQNQNFRKFATFSADIQTADPQAIMLPTGT
jgi:hypothetical protein